MQRSGRYGGGGEGVKALLGLLLVLHASTSQHGPHFHGGMCKSAGRVQQERTSRTMQHKAEDDDRPTRLRIPEAASIANLEHARSQGVQLPVGHAHDEVPIKACLVPKELYEHIVEAGVVKSQWRLDKQIAMGLIAAFYIGFSFTLMMLVGGQVTGWQTGGLDNPNAGLLNFLLGAVGFPLGLFMIVVVGADLFTSDCSYMTVALQEGRASMWHWVKCITLSWWVNLAGSIIMALIVYWAWIFRGREEFTYHLIVKKTSNPFGVCLCKGILANWLVNLAVWIANAAQDVTGKAVGIYLPVSAFITMGGEHCIANQFLFALGKFLGVQVSVKTMIIKNLIPATIGNIIGGAFFVGVMYGFSVGNLFDSTYVLAGKATRGLRPRQPHDLPRNPATGKGTAEVRDEAMVCLPLHQLLHLIVPVRNACSACSSNDGTNASIVNGLKTPSRGSAYMGNDLQHSKQNGTLPMKDSRGSSGFQVPAGFQLDV